MIQRKIPISAIRLCTWRIWRDFSRSDRPGQSVCRTISRRLKVNGTWSSAVLRDRQSKVLPEVGCGDLSEAEEAWPENVDIDINMVKMNL